MRARASAASETHWQKCKAQNRPIGKLASSGSSRSDSWIATPSSSEMPASPARAGGSEKNSQVLVDLRGVEGVGDAPAAEPR
eukprot:681107-Pyramimonas_sp.AAC.1